MRILSSFPTVAGISVSYLHYHAPLGNKTENIEEDDIITNKVEHGFHGKMEKRGYRAAAISMSNSATVETAYKVYVCPRGNLPYMRIYLITDLKLL